MSDGCRNHRVLGAVRALLRNDYSLLEMVGNMKRAIDSITVKWVPGYGIVHHEVHCSQYEDNLKQSEIFKMFSEDADKFARNYYAGDQDVYPRHHAIDAPKKVIFNGPATICIWPDGSKTVVKCSKNDEYDERAGLAACMLKHAYGNAYLKAFDKWVGEDSQPHSTSDECDLDYFDTDQADEDRRKFAQLLESLRNDPHPIY